MALMAPPQYKAPWVRDTHTTLPRGATSLPAQAPALVAASLALWIVDSAAVLAAHGHVLALGMRLDLDRSVAERR